MVLLDVEGGFERVTIRERGFAFAFSSLRTVVRAVLVAWRVCAKCIYLNEKTKRWGNTQGMFEAMMEKMYRGQVSVDCQQLEAMREVGRWPGKAAEVVQEDDD